MSDLDWHTCRDPDVMLMRLQGKESGRKRRLFICACCRRFWNQLDKPCRSVVETAERLADGLASESELRAASTEASAGWFEVKPAEFRVLYGVRALVMAAVLNASVWNLAWLLARVPTRRQSQEYRRQARCHLLRDIFGDPFGDVTFDPAWREWNDGCVVRIAQQIYDERRFDDLPVLADALMEAGCADETILNHCRTPRGHVPGCWVVDALLGKN